MKSIIFIAPPAAGKGTQSELLVDKYNYEHISTGDILRNAVESKSELGNKVKQIMDEGKLVSDDVMIKLISNKLSNASNKPFILDGFPRTLEQAKALTILLNEKNIDYQVIYLELSEEKAKERILGRRTCKCGRSYNIYNEKLKPKVDNICDYCGSTLEKRSDDNEESFKKRYSTFVTNNGPIIEYYKKLNNLVTINVDCDKLEIFNKISEVINND